jgi:hydroxyethylthiazole kinase-like uncharacterized protein yjeF
MLILTHPLILSREQSQQLDKTAIETLGLSPLVLMENAGRSIFEYILENNYRGKMLVCCGKGNNGGDGLVVFRYLQSHGFDAEVFLLAAPESLSTEARVNFEINRKCGMDFHVVPENDFDLFKKKLEQADWIIDGIFGTGLQGLVKPFYQTIIHEINHCKAKVISIDIPSGLDCDTGEILGSCIHAEDTLTLAGLKKGFNSTNARRYLGKITVVDIGIPLDSRPA